MSPNTRVAFAWVALSSVAGALGCGDADDVVGEPAGTTVFFVDNQTQVPLAARWTDIGNGEHRTGPVGPGDVVELDRISAFGSNPRPADSFRELHLHNPDNNELYRQEPIDDDAWTIVRLDEADYGLSEATLTIEPDDLLGTEFGLPPGVCCCQFAVDGDIIEEDPAREADCPQLDSGQCIDVDPNRLTPHPCCPYATGERCRDGA